MNWLLLFLLLLIPSVTFAHSGTGHWVNQTAPDAYYDCHDCPAPSIGAKPSKEQFVAQLAKLTCLTVAVTPTSIVVQWQAPAKHSVTDWVAIYVETAPDTQFGPWQYIPAGAEGTITLPKPASGRYQVRYLVNDGFQRAAVSEPFEVP